MKKLLPILILILSLGSCSLFNKTEATVKTDNETGELKDSRDNKSYVTVKIGDHWWMAQNLCFETENESWYYNNSARNAEFYGRLYTFETAQNACPSGWHLPSDQEWRDLEISLGMDPEEAEDSEYRGTDQGKQLSSKGKSGFNAMLGGFRNLDNDFYEMEIAGVYWSSTSLGKNHAWVRGFEVNNPKVIRRTFGKTYGFSIRCVKD